MTPGNNNVSYSNFRILKYSEVVLSLILFCSPFYTLGEVQVHHGSLDQLHPPDENHSPLNADQTNYDFGKRSTSQGVRPVINEHFDLRGVLNRNQDTLNLFQSEGEFHRNRKNIKSSQEDLDLSEDTIHQSQENLHHPQENLQRSQDDLDLLPQNDLYDLPQSDQPFQKDHRKDFQFREERQNPKKRNIRNKYHYSDKNYDPYLTKTGPKEPYNYLSNNFAHRNHGTDSRASSSNQDRENEFDFPDKIVKDGQVFYRHGANNIDNNQHVENGLLDKEQSDGNFKIFNEMSHESPTSGNDNLSKGFDLLLDHVRQAQENTPSISAAIAGAAIRGSSKGSFSHVIGSAIKGGYFAASAKGYDDKGGSIHSHIQGTGNGAGGGASAIAPGRDGEAFIQVDNSDNGLSIGQSTTYNGEAFVIADVDKDSQYHYERGDNTSSFNDNYKNDSRISFGEAKSSLYSPDISNNNDDSFKFKNIPNYHSDSKNNNQRKKPFGMGLIDNIMEKVHQPSANGYNKGALQTDSPITENYGKINFESSPTFSNEQTHSHPKEKGAVGLVTFPFNTIGSPPGPGELLTQAPVTKIIRPKNNEENFGGYPEELPYYDVNNNEHNNDYYSDMDLKTKENKFSNKNFANFGQNENWQHTFETTNSPNEASLFNGRDKTSTEQFYNKPNLVYQPYSSVLIDSQNNRHLLPPTHTSVNQNGLITNSYNEFPENKFNENDFNGFSNTLSKPGHQEPEERKTVLNPFVSKDTTDYEIKNLQEPILQNPQVPIEAPLENDFNSMNPIISSESWKTSNYPSASKDNKDYDYLFVNKASNNYNYSPDNKGPNENNYPSVNKHTKDYNYPSVSNDAKENNYLPASKGTNNYNYPFINKDTEYYNYPFAGKNANDNGYNYPLISNGAPDYKTRNLQGPTLQKPQAFINASSGNDFPSRNPVTPPVLWENGNYPLYSNDTKNYNIPFLNKDTTDYKMRKSPESILQNTQTSTEVPMETNLHSTNLVTPIHHSFNIPLSNRNNKINTHKIFYQQPPMVGNEIPKTNYSLHNLNGKVNYDPSSSFSYQGPQTPMTNYHLHDQNEKANYDPGSLFSYQGPQTQKTNSHLHNLNEKANYDPGSSFINQDSQAPKTNYNYHLHNQDENNNFDPSSSLSYQGSQVPKPNYPLDNQNEKDNYYPGSSSSFQDPQIPKIFEDNFDPNTPHGYLNHPLYYQNLPKDNYGKITPISNQNQLPINEIVSQSAITNNNFGSSSKMLTTTERMQVITPGAAGQIQHLNASEPGYPNIRVLTINNNDERNLIYQREGTSIGPGEKIPGAPGYKVPPGFRGRVVLGHQLPVNVESRKAVQGYNTKINLTPQRPYSGPVFASVSGPQAASKMNPNFGNGVQITLSSPTTKLSSWRQRTKVTPSDISRNKDLNRKLSTPLSRYTQGNENINDFKQGGPEIIKKSNGQCGYFINECVRPPPFYRNYCSNRFINVPCPS